MLPLICVAGAALAAGAIRVLLLLADAEERQRAAVAEVLHSRALVMAGAVAPFGEGDGDDRRERWQIPEAEMRARKLARRAQLQREEFGLDLERLRWVRWMRETGQAFRDGHETDAEQGAGCDGEQEEKH